MESREEIIESIEDWEQSLLELKEEMKEIENKIICLKSYL